MGVTSAVAGGAEGKARREEHCPRPKSHTVTLACATLAMGKLAS